MEKNKNFFESIKEKFNKSNKRQVVIIILIIGFILIVGLYFLSSKQEKTNDTGFNDYVKNIEENLSDILSKIEGAGKVSVMITVSETNETILASKTTETEINGKITVEKTPITVNGKTITVKESFPKVTGVLIVAEGANNINVINKLLTATMSVIDVDKNKIEIMTMK